MVNIAEDDDGLFRIGTLNIHPIPILEEANKSSIIIDFSRHVEEKNVLLPAVERFDGCNLGAM